MTPATIQKINWTAIGTTIFCGVAVAWLLTMEDVRINSGISKRDYPAMREDVNDLQRRMTKIETEWVIEVRHLNSKVDRILRNMEAR